MVSGWSVYVSFAPFLQIYRSTANNYHSGVMLPFTLSPPAPSSVPRTSTTSATSATATPPFSTALPTPPPASCPASPTSRRPRSTRRSASRRTSTGMTTIPPRRTASDAVAGATRISSMSRARMVLAWLSGSMLRVAGLVLRSKAGLAYEARGSSCLVTSNWLAILESSNSESAGCDGSD